MRPLPAALVGSLMILGLAVAGPASATTVDPGPTAPATATAAPTATVQPTAPAPTATAPAEDPEQEFPAEDFPDIAEGTFTSTPSAGPAGTKITLTSEDACVSPEGEAGLVEVALLGDDFFDTPEDASDAEVSAYDTFSADEDGSWTTTLTIPADSPSDSYFLVYAACYPPDAVVSVEESSAEPWVFYDFADFLVTDAPGAPVATPVVRTPTFTG